ncbi:hypothetical protein QYF36_007772 [Acer negundo]|nr:hypothetical protein QYF36_007772 [Acer negundo]
MAGSSYVQVAKELEPVDIKSIIRPSVFGTATEAAQSGGFIQPDALASEFLPTIKNSQNYGGVMLWSRLYDQSYSSTIKSNV